MPGRKKGFEVSLEMFCVVDRMPIPQSRVKLGSITCSPECAKRRRRQQMKLMEQTECKYCRRPATPEERALYKRWRAAQKIAGDFG